MRALAPTTTRRSAGESRLGAEVEGIVQGVLAECRAAPAQRTVRDVYFMVVERVWVRNQGRAPEERLTLPGESTIGRRVGAAGGAAARRAAARAGAAVPQRAG